MADWPPAPPVYQSLGAFHSLGVNSGVGEMILVSQGFASVTSAAWPAANRALYIPFCVEQTCTAYKMGFVVAVQAGNYDVGIYNENGVRLVSVGSTTVPVAGLASADIADTLLTPGTYFMAMICSTVTTLTVNRVTHINTPALTACGMQQEDLGATTLPANATFADMASTFVPFLAVVTKAVL